RRFRKFDTGNPSRPRCRDEHEDHQKYGDRRHIRIIADAIGGTVDGTQISTLARLGHAELPSSHSGFAVQNVGANQVIEGLRRHCLVADRGYRAPNAKRETVPRRPVGIDPCRKRTGPAGDVVLIGIRDRYLRSSCAEVERPSESVVSRLIECLPVPTSRRDTAKTIVETTSPAAPAIIRTSPTVERRKP